MAVRSSRRVIVISVLAALTMVSAACSGKSAPTSSGPSGSASPTAAQKLTVDTPAAAGQIAKVTWNEWEGEPTTIDPFHSADYTPNTINSNMCENLVALKPDFTFAPGLATSWSYKTPLSLVLQLRKGVTFWDGSPMTADDVVYSLNKNLTDKTTFYNYLFGHVASVVKTGQYEVTIKLSKPDYLLINELADYAGVVVSKKFYQAHPKDVGTPSVGLLCTGPFKFTSWSKGDNITLTRYDGYWNKARMPKVKTLVFKFLTDDASITSALLSGQIDGAYDPPLAATKQLQSSSVGKLYFGPHQGAMTFTYSNPKGAMANIKLRKALQIAIDWKGLSTTVLQGTGEPIRALMPPTVFTYAKSELMAAYDKLPAVVSADYTAAKKLVAQAGSDAKRKIVMALPSGSAAQQFCGAVRDAAHRIGLDNFQLKVVPVDEYTNYLYDAKTRAGVDMLWTDFWPNTPDPLDYLGIAAVAGASFNQYGYTALGAQYNQAQSTKDPVARAKLVAAMMAKTTSDLLPMAPGVTHSARLWMNNKITGAPASFDYVYYPWAADLGATK